MKKTLVILVILALTVFAVMAEESFVTLNSTVAEESDFVFTLTATSGTTGYNAAAAGTADFKITSTKVVNFRGANVKVDIEVSVAPWTGTNLGGTNALILGDLVAADTTGNGTGNGKLQISVDNSLDKYTVHFGHGHKNAFDVGTFSVSWVAVPELAADNYTATVTISYSQV